MGRVSVIYDFPSIDDPIRQGDIFHAIPRIEISLDGIVIPGEGGSIITKWVDVYEEGTTLSIVVPAQPVTAIIASQDCDARNGRDITLCEIRAFRDVELKSKDTQKPDKWKNIITQHARMNQKWFYLPPDDSLGFEEKMAVDFRTTLRVPRVELEGLRNLRIGRLNTIAEEHFRERIAEFFRRYPYDEWYALNREELEHYTKEYPETEPFPWQ